MEKIYKGILNVSNGKLDITDPCYNKDVWCRKTIDVTSGKYKCSFFRDDDTKRIAVSMIELENKDYDEDNVNWVFIGEIGVDSGLAGYFIDKPDFTSEDKKNDLWSEFIDELEKEDRKNKDSLEYSTYLNVKTDGFFTSTGWGDGGYSVYAIYENKKIVALKTVFMFEDNDEDDDY